MSIHQIRTANKYLLRFGAVCSCIIVLYQSEFWLELNRYNSNSELGFYIFSIIFICALTAWPFMSLVAIANGIAKRSHSINLASACLLVSTLLVAGSLAVYIAASTAIEGDSSSTASVIYAVIPFYILIAGCIFYGPMYWIAKRSST